MSPEQAVDKLSSADADISSELQKLARMRSRQSEHKDSEVGAGITFGVLDHVIAMSVGKIDQAIVELTQLRHHLQNESDRVHSEIACYTQMTQVALQVALTSAEAITQSLPELRSAGSEHGLQLNSVTRDDVDDIGEQ